MNPQEGQNTYLTMFQSASWDQEMASGWTATTTNIARKRSSSTSRNMEVCHHPLTVQTEDLPCFAFAKQNRQQTKINFVKSISEGWIDNQTRRLGAGRVSEVPNEDLPKKTDPSMSSASMESSSSAKENGGWIGIRPSPMQEDDGWFIFGLDEEQPTPPIQILKFSCQDIQESGDDMSDVSLCFED